MSYILSGGEWCVRAGGAERRLSEMTARRSRAFYFYDLDDALLRARAYAMPGARVHYAMKANSNGRLLKTFANEGLGVDVVSLGEMQRALDHGFAPQKVIFSGVGKDREELEFAVRQGILQINVESFEELKQLNAICERTKKSAEVALRLNVHIVAPTHKGIQTATPESKFGLDVRLLPEVLQWLKGHANHMRLSALTVHIGSQILDLDVFARMGQEIGRLYRDVKAQGFALKRLDLGGGLGIDYKDETGEADFERLKNYQARVASAHQTGAELLFEPGRFLVARMGVLLARVIYVKKGVDREFAILNAGMNMLMRPALYQAYHRISPLKPRAETSTYTVVGPICESTDTFADQRQMPRLEADEWVAIFDAGAYGAAMSNTYNEYPLPEQWSMLGGALEIN